MARLFLLLAVTSSTIWSRYMNAFLVNRTEACDRLSCDDSDNVTVCGVRDEMSAVRLKLFANECALLKYGCSVEHKDAYGLISMTYCKRSGVIDTENEIVTNNLQITRNFKNSYNSECEINCNFIYQDVVCGIKQDGEGYRVRLFENTCELLKYNCNATIPFIRTDKFICEGTLQVLNSSINNATNDEALRTRDSYGSTQNFESIIVVDGSMLGQTTDANDTIENFFAATHVLDLPLRQLDSEELKTRRMLLKNVAATKVFQPWITIPKQIKTDFQHLPTLSTCYHKCPTQCPDTYSPVCGVPGILAREPSIMFQNHCYMDVAQCKMYWENKSSTAISSSYIESSFLFCLGDQLNGMYRFLPLIKTLQHMGRLKKKGKFRYRLMNMKFFNNYAYKQPKLMG